MAEQSLQLDILSESDTRRRNLVRPATPKEELLTELRRVKLSNLSSSQSARLADRQRSFCNNFLRLCYSRFGLSDSQISRFKDEHIIEMDNLLIGRARRIAYLRYLIYLVPIFGQIFLFEHIEHILKREPPLVGSDSWNYYVSRSFLKKNLGQDYLPMDELRATLKQKQAAIVSV